MIMEKRIYSVLLCMLLCGIISEVNAQFSFNFVNTSEVLKAEPIDDVIFTVQYELSFIPDTLNPDKKTEETMMLKIGKKSSVFYSYARFLTDSIIEIDKKTGASEEVIKNHLTQYTPKVGYKVYKNYPAGKVTFTDQVGTNRFICEEKVPIPKWDISPDTMTIHSYPCQKATCNYLGRTYQAWFTSDIPRSEGPWKLQGLPGLILKAEDTQRHYQYECSGIVQSRNGEDKIMFSADGYEPISRKDLNKLYARFAADPVGYITNTSPNVKITIKGDDGRPASNPKNTPFNPIER